MQWFDSMKWYAKQEPPVIFRIDFLIVDLDVQIEFKIEIASPF